MYSNLVWVDEWHESMQQVVDIRPDGQWEFRSDAVEYVLCHTRDSYAFFMAKSKVAQ